MRTTRPGPVVVGVDDSIAARTAVVHAAWEAERRGVPLQMVYGYLVPTPCLTPLAPLLDDRALVQAGQDRLDRFARTVRSRRPHLLITTSAVPADGATALIQKSATAGLVVVGAPRWREFAGLSIGSVAGQVMAQASCPVLVVPGSLTGPASDPGPVLVGVDGSASGDSVLQFGFAEASARRVPLAAVHVWSGSGFSGLRPADAGPHRDRVRARLQQAAEHRLADALAGWQDQYGDVGVRRWVIHNSETAARLLEVAGAISADLLVVGSRGRGAVTGAVLGSVSRALSTRAGAPVAVIGPRVRPYEQRPLAGVRSCLTAEGDVMPGPGQVESPSPEGGPALCEVTPTTESGSRQRPYPTRPRSCDD